MKRRFLTIIILGIGGYFFFSHGEVKESYDAGAAKSVTVSDDGFVVPFSSVFEKTVGELLDRARFGIRDGDHVFPDRATVLASGMTVFVERKKDAVIAIDGGKKTVTTYARTVEDALDEVGANLRDEDITTPARESFLTGDTAIKVIRVDIKEEMTEKKIAYDTTENTDDKLSFRKRIVTQKGVNGVLAYHYRVGYHDGKEVSRKLLGSEVTKDPVREIVAQGTFVKVGRTRSGGASWYAYTGTMAAASLWLPHGAYARITNTDNSKSVIVQINDSGPYVGGRIVDLDKVAFAKIASTGAGVVNVKMEEIIN